MKKKFLRFFTTLLFVCSFIPGKLNAAPTATHDGVYLDEIAIGSGYAWGHLKFSEADYNAVPIFARFGFNMNSVFGMKESKSTLQSRSNRSAIPSLNPTRAWRRASMFSSVISSRSRPR